MYEIYVAFYTTSGVEPATLLSYADALSTRPLIPQYLNTQNVVPVLHICFSNHTYITCWKPTINKPYQPILEINKLNLVKRCLFLYYFMLLHDPVPY